MFRILLRKFLEVFIFLLFIMFMSFLFIRLAPGDPVLTILNVDELSVSQEQVEAVREEMGFNDSLPVQFGNWLLDFVRLDFGVSYSTGQPVMQTLMRALPATAELTIGALLVMLVIAIPLGSLSALHRGSWVDRSSRMLSIVGAAVPSFWLGLILIDMFGVRFGNLPTMGRDGFTSLILPSLTLGLAISSVYVRLCVPAYWILLARSSFAPPGQEGYLKAGSSCFTRFGTVCPLSLRYSVSVSVA